MNRTLGLILGVLGTLAVLPGQPYRCDWSVVGIGGGEMSGTYKCGSTVGQTAAGFITASNFWAVIGYWLPEGQVGIREAAQWSSGPVRETKLYAPAPNPSRTAAVVRYSLAAEGPVALRVHDLSGRVVRTLVSSSVKRGAYSVTWNGADDRGRELANGIYFCRLTAGSYRATEKLVLQR